MKTWIKRIGIAAAALAVLMVFAGIAQRINSAQAAAAASVEADFNGKQMPADMVGPHTWWAAQTLAGGATLDHDTAGTSGATVAGLRLTTAHNNGTVALTLDGDDDVIAVLSGGAATINLPSTPLVGKVYTVLHNNGTVATTIVALGAASGYSINGAASDNSMNAAADMAIIVGTSTGWAAGFSNH